MAYRIAGVDVHKKRLAVVVSDVGVEASTSLSGGRSGPVPTNCARWPSGWRSARSRKS